MTSDQPDQEALDEFFAELGQKPHVKRGDAPTSVGEAAGGDWAKTLAAASCWAQSGNSYFPVSDVIDKIPPGAYRCMVSNQGPYFEKMKISIDHLLALPDSA